MPRKGLELRAAQAFGLSVRPAAESDAAFLLALYATVRGPEYAVLGWSEPTLRQFLAGQERAQRAHYLAAFPGAEQLIVERAGEAIGRFYLDLSPAGFRIVDISLMPAEQRKGLGRALIEDLLDFAAECGCPVDLQVARLNPARSLYEQLGFVASCDGSGHYQMRWLPAAATDSPPIRPEAADLSDLQQEPSRF